MTQLQEQIKGQQLSPFRADPKDELPVGVQLGWRLRALIRSGRIANGERLPSVRELADWGGVSLNTARAIYGRLEAQGLVATEHGRGTFVSAASQSSPLVEEIAGEALERAADAGIDPRDVAIAALVATSLPDPPTEDGQTADPDDEPDRDELKRQLAVELDLSDDWLEADDRLARQELRRQIGRIEAQLSSYVRDVERPGGRTLSVEPRIAGTEELERTRDALLSQLTAARGKAAARANRELRAREVREAMLADPKSHRWEAVSAAEVGEPGGTTWQVAPRFGPLGALMSWWQVKVSGGCPLAAAA